MKSNLTNTQLIEFDPTGLTANYQAFGSEISHEAIKVQFINTSDVDIYVSDQLRNNWRIPSGGTISVDEPSYQVPNKDAQIQLPRNTQLYVKQVTGAASEGNLWAHILTRNNS